MASSMFPSFQGALAQVSRLATLLLLPGCTANGEPGRQRDVTLPALVPQRVTATVTRPASRLVHLETEHEALLTTPGHPVATPRLGWVSAGRLRPGDWVVSQKLGAARLLSVRDESAPRPVPVFNLSVASSYAYFVGTERLLVHNTKCKPKPSESREEAIARAIRERDEVRSEIEATRRTTPLSAHISELIARRDQLSRKINKLRFAIRKEKGLAAPSRDERSRQLHEVEHEDVRRALESAQQELAALESRPPTSDAERAKLPARREQLDKQIRAFQRRADRTSHILSLLEELEKLERLEATDQDRSALDERKRQLRADLNRVRKQERDAQRLRQKRTERQSRAEVVPAPSEMRRRMRRTARYVADVERQQDQLEHLAEELASRRGEAPSEGRDARILHLTDRIETMKKLFQARRDSKKVMQRKLRTLRAREKQIANRQDTNELDRKLEQTQLELNAIRNDVSQLRQRERLLALLHETPWAHAPGPVDEARLRELERELAEDVERELAEDMERESQLVETALAEAPDVDELLDDREQRMPQSPPPEPATRLPSSSTRLEQELREGRAALEAALSGLADEHAHIRTTQAASSSGPSWQERLRAVQQEQVELRAHWQANLQTRLDSARLQLQLRQSIAQLRDEASEAELAREIALLERELRNFG